MAAQAVLFIQNGGYLQVLLTPVWDTSWLLAENTIVGRLLHTLVGYTDQPDGLQVIAYVVTIVAINLLMRVVNRPKGLPTAAPAAAE
jgi:high-affinity iron transporter